MEKTDKKYLMVIVIVIIMFVAKYENEKEEYKSPELVSTINSMNHEYCSIIVHNKQILEKTQLALFLIELCGENNFDNIKFATDVRGYPSGVSLSVYLTENDFVTGNQYMNVRYEMIECRKDCNIKDDSENYQLYIDGKLVENYDLI